MVFPFRFDQNNLHPLVVQDFLKIEVGIKSVFGSMVSPCQEVYRTLDVVCNFLIPIHGKRERTDFIPIHHPL